MPGIIFASQNDAKRGACVDKDALSQEKWSQEQGLDSLFQDSFEGVPQVEKTLSEVFAEESSGKASAKDRVMSVRVSGSVEQKVVQLHKIRKYSVSQPTWGRDQKLLKYNLLLVPSSKNYTVLLAMGRRDFKLPRAI